MIRRRYYPTLKKTRRPTFRQQVGMSLQRNPVKNYEHNERPTTEDDIQRALRLVKKSNLYPRLAYFNITEEIPASTEFNFNLTPSNIIVKLNQSHVKFNNFIVPSVSIIKNLATHLNPLQFKYTLTYKGVQYYNEPTYTSIRNNKSYSIDIGGFYINGGRLYGPDWNFDNYDGIDIYYNQFGVSSAPDGAVQCVYNETGSSLLIQGTTQTSKLTLLVNVILLTA